MKVIKPIQFTPSLLVSTTAPEPTATWSSGTTYAAGAKVLYQVTVRGITLNHIFQSLVNSNTTVPGVSPLSWVDLGPSNRHAMFDDQVSTPTVSTSPLTVVFKPGVFNSLALFGLVGTQLVITVRNGTGGPVVYSKTFDLDGTVLADWYQYYFEPWLQLPDIVMTDIPPYGNAEVTLTVTNSGSVQIGLCSFGTFYDLGESSYGATAGITDYSRKDTDEFGVTTFVRRDYSKRMTARLLLLNGQLTKVQQTLIDLRARPCVWIGSDDFTYSPLIVFGFYRDFSIEIAYPTTSYCSLEIEGLT